MKFLICILATYLLLFISCQTQTQSSTFGNPFIDTLKSFNKEIPTNSDGSKEYFYILAKAKEKQLNLDSLENGVNNLQIRVWYYFARSDEQQLLIISNKDSIWTASVYSLLISLNGKSESIISKKLKQVTPRSGWTEFLKKALELKILTLPDQHDIKDYYLDTDGRSYNVEIATKNRYRFYSYQEPEEYKDQFWQAKNMTSILKLFEEELNVKY